jgi:hypothetical protein
MQRAPEAKRAPRTPSWFSSRFSSRFSSLFSCGAGGLAAPLLLAGTLLAPTKASAYAIPIHVELARRALAKSGLDAQAAPLDLKTATAIREAIDAYARSEPSVKEAWTRRYPTPGAFDVFALKQLLLLSPQQTTFGIDRTDERLASGKTLLEVAALATGHPDEDWRNRERLAYDDKRHPIKDKYSQPVPADPSLLNMGKLGALSSQAHAHYGLPQLQFSDEPSVLQTEPRRFAKAAGWEGGPIVTLASEMAQLHLDLALLAALSDGPSQRELSYYYAGAGFHYLEDVGNQIHTMQVGLFDFFKDAFLERLKLGLLTGGGYLGKMRSLASIGIDIITSHHVLSEELTGKRFREAMTGTGSEQAKHLLTVPAEDDPDFSRQLDEALAKLGPRPEHGEFALAITRTLIDVSSFEGDKVYRATMAIADPALRTRHKVFSEEDDPDKFLKPASPQLDQDLQAFWSLQERAFRRVGTALRRWVALQEKAVTGAATPEAKEALRKAVLDRLVKRQLRMLDETEARLQRYLADPPRNVSAPERDPKLLAVDLGLVGLFVGLPAFLFIRRRRRAR